MKVGSHQYSEVQLSLGCLILLSLIGNLFIFQKLHRTYSVKYQLLRNPFFRGRICLVKTVTALYWVNLFLPYLLLIGLFIYQLTKSVSTAFVVLINGLLMVSIIYQTNAKTFYYKLTIVFVLLVGSELLTLFLTSIDRKQTYSPSSAVFFAVNGILVSLSIWSRQTTYWDLKQAFDCMRSKVSEINGSWGKEGSNVPRIVDGGLYGHFNHNHQTDTNTIKVPVILYLVSLGVLVAYSFTVGIFDGNLLGMIASVAIVTFDMLIFVLSSMSEKTRSPSSIMIIIFTMRFFLFVFGSLYWFLGYCILYIIIGTFIGQLIIEKRFPKRLKQEHQQTVNALKTPEFMLFFLTLELIVMIVSLYFTQDKKLRAEVIQLSEDSVWPFWAIGVASIIFTVILISYLASLRVLYRKINRINELTTYYFGLKSITEYHIFLVVTYTFILIFGIYCFFAFKALLLFLCCIFMPLIYQFFTGLAVCWQNNDFYILAQIQDYNKREKKKHEIERNNKKMLQILASKNKTLQLKIKGIEQEESDHQLNNNTKNDAQAQARKSNDGESQRSDKKLDLKKVESSLIEDFKPLEDWRDPSKQITFPRLLLYTTPNDRRLLIFLTLIILFLIAFAVCTSVLCANQLGLQIFICLLSYVPQMSYFRCVKTHHEIQVQEIIGIVGGFLTGMIYWAINWTVPVGGLVWSILMIVLLLWLLIKTLQRKLPKLLYALQISQILLLLIFDCILVNSSLPIEFLVATLVLIVLFVLIVVAVILYKLNGDSAPNWMFYIFGSLIFLVICSVMIVGFILDSISDFVGFSVTALSFIGIGLIFSAYQFYKRHRDRFEVPVIYSAYGLPCYKFDSTLETLKKDDLHLYIYICTLIGLIFYSEITFIFFPDAITGIYTLCLFEVLMYISLTKILTKNYYSLGLKKEFITQKLLKETFQKLRTKYMAEITDSSSSDLINEMGVLEENISREPENSDLYERLVHANDKKIVELEQEQKFLFYWMIIIEFELQQGKKKHMQKTLRAAEELKDKLMDSGIFFHGIEEAVSLQVRFQKLQAQIDALSPTLFVIYESLVKKYWRMKKKQDDTAAQASQEENKRNEARQNQLCGTIGKFAKSREKAIDDYKRLCQQTRKKRRKFEDPQFRACDQIMGALVEGDRAIIINAWRRPRDSAKLLLDSASFNDVVQGQIGDCYLISALGALGDEYIKKCLGYQESDSVRQNPKETGLVGWDQKSKYGLYMVNFKKYGKDLFVIVDDQLPSAGENGDSEWLLGHCDDIDEIWVNIIEKAYAKLYGGYDKIAGGKSHIAMADLTGGFPSEIDLTEYRSNTNPVWKELTNAQLNGYLIAAGSPQVGTRSQGQSSDRYVSKKGIVQGHAYCVIDVKQVQSHRLIKLKNPHARVGQEWTGAWSDSSELMSVRMMKLLDYEKKDDGIFWMSVDDFVLEFKNLYLCRIFGATWKKFDVINGQWTKDNSFGPPTNKQASKNPQYGITVYRQTTVFVSLTQEAENSLKGKNSVSFRVYKNSGKRVSTNSATTENKVDKMTGISTLVTCSSQVQLSADSYPYTFTLVVFTKNQGDTGTYNLQIYSNTESTQIVLDQRFDKNS